MGIETGGDGEAEVEGFFFGHLFGAEFGEGEGGGDFGGDFGDLEFGVEFDGGEAVELEVLKLLEGFGGAALEEGPEFDGAFHLKEVLLGIGIVEPAVLGLDFDALGAEGLEARVGVLFEEDFFGGAGGEEFGVEAVAELVVFDSLLWVGGEEGFGGGVEAVAVGVFGGLLFAGGGARAGGVLGVGLIGLYLCCAAHSLSVLCMGSFPVDRVKDGVGGWRAGGGVKLLI